MMRDTAIEQHDQLMFWRPEETVVLTCVEKKKYEAYSTICRRTIRIKEGKKFTHF